MIGKRRNGSSACRREALFGKSFTCLDQSVGRVADRVGDGRVDQLCTVVAELEPAVAALVPESKLTVPSGGLEVGVGADGRSEPRERRGHVRVVDALETEVVPRCPGTVRILNRDDPIGSACRRLEVALVAGLVVRSCKPSNDLTGVEDERRKPVTLCTALPAALR